MRIGEALALTMADFHAQADDRMFVRIDKSYVSDLHLIREPKNHKMRTIPLADPVVAVLSERFPALLPLQLRQKSIAGVSGRGEDPDSPDSAHQQIFPWTARTCNARLKKTCAKLGLPPFHCHEFRHTFISNLIAGGIPLPAIEHVSGDTQETILRRYSHMFEHEEAKILAILEEL